MVEQNYLNIKDIATSETVKKILNVTPPSVLYHYTSREGLIGMLEQRVVYASNVRYLNDENEIALAVRLAQGIIFERLSSADSEDTILYNEIKSWLYSLESQINVFAFSMTENGDLLSQWRAYCKPNNGYSIGIDPQWLLSNARVQSSFYLARCEYNKNNQLKTIASLIDDVKALYEKSIREDGVNALDMTMTYFVLWFFVIAPTIKDAAFEEEKEWRLISWLSYSSLGDGNIYYRDGRSLLMPYIKVKLTSPKVDQLPITEVIVGPSLHKEIERTAVLGLLIKSNASARKVKSSDIPYRGPS